MTKSPVCIDASFAVKLAIPEGGSDAAEVAWGRWHDDGFEVVAPGLIWYELTSVVRKRVYRNLLTLDEARDALEYLLALEVTTLSGPDLHRSACELATMANLAAAYDAHYIAAALALGCPLWTADRGLHETAARVLDDVNLVG